MTDTKAPPGWTPIIMGLMPSLNTSIVAIVTAVVSIGGTIAAQRWQTTPAPKLETVAVKTIPIDPKLSILEKKVDDQAADIAAIRAELAKRAKRPTVVSPPPKQ